MQIPLVDLSIQHRQISDEITSELSRVMDAGHFILGEEVREFESDYAEFSGVAHCIGVANGTDAIELILRAADIGPGDEVIVPANTFIATALAVIRAGATPVLADCELHAFTIDCEDASRRLTGKTKAIIPVHLYGQMAEMERLQAVTGPDVLLVEDCAQVHGAARHGRGAGTWGIGGATSFYPGKNLGAYGDAGAVITSRADVASKVRALRNYGGDLKYEHPEIGFNSRLDNVQAIVLRAKLRHLKQWNESRTEAAGIYFDLLGGRSDIKLPEVLEGNDHVWHLFVVRIPERDRVLNELHSKGIGAGIHYPTPLHLQGAMSGLGHAVGDFPNAELAAGEILSLPIYPGITSQQQELVAETLTTAIG